jgi:hypothetical protein
LVARAIYHLSRAADATTYNDVVGEVVLREQMVSGYARTVISTTYHQSSTKIICLGQYEVRASLAVAAVGRYMVCSAFTLRTLHACVVMRACGWQLWWVVRTRWRFDVLKKIPFGVASPQCDWDGINNRWGRACVRARVGGVCDDVSLSLCAGRYRAYATIGATQVMANVDIYTAENFLFAEAAPLDRQGYNFGS